jgi:microcin C transport system ATP-binding protein
MITHDMDVLRAMVHQVMVLQNGRMLEVGPAEQVLYKPRHGYTRSLLAAFGDA